MFAIMLSAFVLAYGHACESPTIEAPTKVWVYLHDKGFSDAASRQAAIDELARMSDPRTVQRRQLRRTAPGLFDARDLPIATAYLAGIEATGVKTHIQSRWLNAVSLRATAAQLAAIGSLPFVDRIEPVRGGRRAPAPTAARVGEHSNGHRSIYGLADEQINQISLPSLHAQGYTGEGVIVGILDTGFRRDHIAFNQPGHAAQVIAEHDFINNDANAGIDPGDHPDQHVHGTLILGCLAAYMPDEYVGGATGARFILCKTEDLASETPIEEDNYIAGLEFIESHGGDMATSSLGYIDWYTQADLDGQTAVTTIGVNIATENGLHVSTAAGNQGNDGDPSTSRLIAPADAMRVISCGAVDSVGAIAGFSSDGPTADGRQKPELLARGVSTYTVWPYDVSGYASASGTSLSTPLVACALACLIQARPDWTVDQMRTMLLASASDQVAVGHPDPLMVRGWGIVSAAGALSLDCNGNGVIDSIDIATGTSIDTNHNGTANECEAGGCPADFDQSGFVDTDDFDAFVHAFEAGSDLADVDGSGFVDLDDYVAFVHAYESGC